MKKLFVLLLLAFFSIGHVFAQDVTIDGLGYSLLSDGTAYVSAFQDATLTGAITIPSSITSDTTTYQVIALGNNCFDSCTKITSVNLPVGIKYLGDRCFYGCSALESCNIPNTVIEIGNGCFEHCWNLKSVDIQGSPANLIGTFTGCTRLQSMNLPSSVTDMTNAFYGCTSLESVSLPTSVTNLTGTFGGCTSLVSVNIPPSVTNLSGTFEGCTSLTSMSIPPSVTNLTHTFSGCSSLKSVEILSFVTELWGTFEKCMRIESVNIPSSVTSLVFTFNGCTNLKSIDIPSSVKYFNDVFTRCTNLEKVTCHWTSLSDVEMNGIDFKDVPISLVSLLVPKGTSNMYKSLLPWSEFGNIIEQDSTTIVSQCELPTITYTDKKLSIASATEDAKVHYDITCTDVKSGDLWAVGEVLLDQAYKITAYATRDGYIKSDNAVAMLYFVNGTLDNPTAVKAMRADSRGILVTSVDGRIMVSGLNDGETVSVYSTGGVMLGMGTAYAGQAEINVSTQDTIVVIKVGNESIKYAM